MFPTRAHEAMFIFYEWAKGKRKHNEKVRNQLYADQVSIKQWMSQLCYSGRFFVVSFDARKPQIRSGILHQGAIDHYGLDLSEIRSMFSSVIDVCVELTGEDRVHCERAVAYDAQEEWLLDAIVHLHKTRSEVSKFNHAQSWFDGTKMSSLFTNLTHAVNKVKLSYK